MELGAAPHRADPASNSIIDDINTALMSKERYSLPNISWNAQFVSEYAVPLHKRPKYQGLFGAVFGVASFSGPLIGGVFTTDVTWRWCFYINLPLGGVVFVVVFFLLHVPAQTSTNTPLKEKLRQLNLLGMIALIPGVVCLCLALQWAGTTYNVS